MDQIKLYLDKIAATEKGISLVEVMIAIMLFAVFITAFMTGQGNNVMSSYRMKEDLKLKRLAEMQYNLTMLDPPDFSRPLADTKSETKPFEDYPGFEYTMSYRQIFIPDIGKIMGEQEDPNDPDRQNRRKIMQEFKDNMEKLVWQLSIEVRDKNSGNSFVLAGWVYYDKAKVAFKGF